MVKPDYTRIELLEGDITRQTVDAIVNAANETLLGGGGVDGAIHRAAGPDLLAECGTLGGCPTGGSKITRGYRLPAAWVIHTVGPVYRDGNHGEPALLASCHRTALELARDHECASVAFPAVSCGVYGYPMDQAAEIALRTTAEFLAEYNQPQAVRFVLFGHQALEVFQEVYDRLANG